jgi:hypothetical protein
MQNQISVKPEHPEQTVAAKPFTGPTSTEDLSTQKVEKAVAPQNVVEEKVGQQGVHEQSFSVSNCLPQEFWGNMPVFTLGCAPPKDRGEAGEPLSKTSFRNRVVLPKSNPFGGYKRRNWSSPPLGRNADSTSPIVGTTSPAGPQQAQAAHTVVGVSESATRPLTYAQSNSFGDAYGLRPEVGGQKAKEKDNRKEEEDWNPEEELAYQRLKTKRRKAQLSTSNSSVNSWRGSVCPEEWAEEDQEDFDNYAGEKSESPAVEVSEAEVLNAIKSLRLEEEDYCDYFPRQMTQGSHVNVFKKSMEKEFSLGSEAIRLQLGIKDLDTAAQPSVSHGGNSPTCGLKSPFIPRVPQAAGIPPWSALQYPKLPAHNLKMLGCILDMLDLPSAPPHAPARGDKEGRANAKSTLTSKLPPFRTDNLARWAQAFCRHLRLTGVSKLPAQCILDLIIESAETEEMRDYLGELALSCSGLVDYLETLESLYPTYITDASIEAQIRQIKRLPEFPSVPQLQQLLTQFSLLLRKLSPGVFGEHQKLLWLGGKLGDETWQDLWSNPADEPLLHSFDGLVKLLVKKALRRGRFGHFAAYRGRGKGGKGIHSNPNYTPKSNQGSSGRGAGGINVITSDSPDHGASTKVQKGGKGGGKGKGKSSAKPLVNAEKTGAFAVSLECFNCGRFGHYKADCKSPPKCRNCGKFGHIKKECKAPPAQSGKGKTGKGASLPTSAHVIKPVVESPPPERPKRARDDQLDTQEERAQKAQKVLALLKGALRQGVLSEQEYQSKVEELKKEYGV